VNFSRFPQVRGRRSVSHARDYKYLASISVDKHMSRVGKLVRSRETRRPLPPWVLLSTVALGAMFGVMSLVGAKGAACSGPAS
jgi:hypothetical protein